jgi:hypothetical protein
LAPFVLALPVIISNLETAQVNIFLLFLLLLALFAVRHRRDVAAGVILGVITAVKLTPGLFIAYFAWKRAWGVVAGATIGLVMGWVVLPILAFGVEGYVDVTRAWFGVVHRFVTEGIVAEGAVGFRHTNQSLSAAIHRHLSHVAADAHRENFYLNVVNLAPAAVEWLVRAAQVAIVVALAWIGRSRLTARDDPRLPIEYGLLAIATLWLSPISWINHYVILLIPFAAVCEAISRLPESGVDPVAGLLAAVPGVDRSGRIADRDPEGPESCDRV